MSYEEHLIQEPNNKSELTLISDSVHRGDLLIQLYEWSLDPDDDIPHTAHASLFLTPWKVRELRDWLTYWLDNQEVQNASL